ncbi:MAG: hypothetical protein LBH03_05600 [Holophagales bacterium]|jgi:glycerophosphoryl diester phosphodiesterase|nr:hypothetical protein [Holophagales bacterium]
MFVLAHHSLLSGHPGNSLQAFSAATKEGFDGFALCVQPTADAVCVVIKDSDLGHITSSQGLLRKMKFSELPKLKNGESIPKLLDLLELPAKLINIELKGEPGWKNALSAVEASDSLGRVIFSSAEHSEILQLWAACPQAKCGFIWEIDEADALTKEEILNLPESLMLHIPAISVEKKPDFWEKYNNRLVVWDLSKYENMASIGFQPTVCIVG